MTLIGHNGAGKTTLIYYLTGLFPTLSDHPFLPHFHDHITPFQAGKFAYVPEISYLEGNLCAQDYYQLYCKTRCMNPKTMPLESLLERVKLNTTPTLPLKHYSKGMKQRLLIALALIGESEVMIFDEPFSGLDLFGKEVIEALLLELKKRTSIIVSTHDLEFAYRLGEEIWILKGGEIVHKEYFQTLDVLKETFANYSPQQIR